MLTTQLDCILTVDIALSQVLCNITFFCLYHRYSGKENFSNMVILNIKLLSGFVVDTASLVMVSCNCNPGRNRNIQTVFIDLW